MADYAVHDTVIKEMQAKKWLFCDLFLQFDKSINCKNTLFETSEEQRRKARTKTA